VFDAGSEQRVLDDSNLAKFDGLIRSIGEVRHADGPHECRWWRLHPERWLASLILKNISAMDDQVDPRWCYSQVPAFSAADRAMIDGLTVTREGRLALLELKADEDIHLPLQGIDYWARVTGHHERGELQKFGYFARARTFCANSIIADDGACTSHASCNRHAVAIHFAGN
jgi:hypothetical protein